MAKGAYIGVDGVARKINKGYIGVFEHTGYEPVWPSDWEDIRIPISQARAQYVGTSYSLDNTTGLFTVNQTALFDDTNAGTSGVTCYMAGSYTCAAPGTYSATEVYVITKSVPYAYVAKLIREETGYKLARKIKKAYIGIGGVARPCWAGGELAYYGTITPLNTARYRLAATTVGDYAIFGGGDDGDNIGSSKTDAYNSSLTHSNPTVLSKYRQVLAATSIGNYALFGGGASSDTWNEQTVVDAYDTSLTRTTPTKFGQGRFQLAATTVGNWALFGGGNNNGSYSSTFGIVDAYNTSLTREVASSLSADRTRLAATTVGNHAIFGGGHGGLVASAVVDAYDASVTRTTITALSTARHTLSATTVGSHALFGGGISTRNTSASNGVSVVDAYDSSLTRTTVSALSTAKSSLAATTIGDYAMFGGGANADGTFSKVVDVYDTSLTKTTTTNLNKDRNMLAATTVGNYALFGGGLGSSTRSEVDAYTVA